MAIKKVNNRWRVDLQPGGRQSKRIRKIFDTKAEAMRFEAHIRALAAKQVDWNPEPPDKRRLSELIERWFLFHGQNLKDGAGRKRLLLYLCEKIRNPVASQMTANVFTEYRAKRLTEVTANTLNHEQNYLSAVFNELRRAGEWRHANPIADVRKLKVNEKELSFLTHDQIRSLLTELNQGKNKDTLPVTKLCLSTGLRWNEAESLRRDQVHHGMIHLGETKNGKTRSIPIDETLEKELLNRPDGRLFGSCYNAFRHALKRTGIELPEGQSAHVLRHTFASHFIMNGGNILTLQKILGHHSVTMTMRYAHLALDYLEETKRLNPLATIQV